jgi:hypothetical protein
MATAALMVVPSPFLSERSPGSVLACQVVFQLGEQKKVCRSEFRRGGGRGPYAPVAVCLAAIAIQSFITAEVLSPNLGAHLTIFSPGLGTCVENSEHQHTMGESKFYDHHMHVFLNGHCEVGDECNCLIFFFGFRCL